jgi:hypothetical protein
VLLFVNPFLFRVIELESLALPESFLISVVVSVFACVFPGSPTLSVYDAVYDVDPEADSEAVYFEE